MELVLEVAYQFELVLLQLFLIGYPLRTAGCDLGTVEHL
jgi:hypothetical protein